MRLFVAVVPPEGVLGHIGELGAALRDDSGGSSDGDHKSRVRWTTRGQWHVTLRFLGEVAEPEQLTDAMATLGTSRIGSVEAELVAEPIVLGRSVLCLPVHGLDELARAVSDATAHIGQPSDPRPFRGHVTVARVRGRRSDLSAFGNIKRISPGGPTAIRWAVHEVHVMRSHLRSDGSRYESLSVTPLALDLTQRGHEERRDDLS